MADAPGRGHGRRPPGGRRAAQRRGSGLLGGLGQLGGCIPNFYVQESFDEFNSDWSREIVDRPIIQRDGYVEVPTAPGLGIDLDWDRLAAHPYQREHLLHLSRPAGSAATTPMPAPDDRAAKVAPGPTAAGLTADPIGSPDPGR